MSDDYVFFWDGPFSQWHPSVFELDGIEYNCAEQYMMAEKARLFEDHETLEEILEAEDPDTQKKLGRLVSNFDKDYWEEDLENGYPRCWNIVWRGNMAKFSQNPDLLKELLATGDAMLVEASPYDRIWGVGLKASDPRIKNPENWQGSNWLGEVLTVVKSFLKASGEPYTDSLKDKRVLGE